LVSLEFVGESEFLAIVNTEVLTARLMLVSCGLAIFGD
jgi:hypothetical protein